MIGFRSTPPVDETPLDPAIAAELAALDAALAGDAIDDDTLAALVRDVQAAAPVMPPDARATLNERFAEAPATRARRPRRRFAAIGSGALATVLVGVFAITALQSPSDDSGSGLSDVVAPASRSESGDAGMTADEARAIPDMPASAPPVERFGAGESTAAERRVARAAELEVRVARDRLAGAAREVEVIARAAGGYIADSQLTLATQGAGRAPSGSWTLRVQSSRLDDAIGRLGRLGVVTTQQRSSDDITAESDSAGRRLRVAEREREALLRALGKADRSAEIASLRRRLDDNQRQRAALRREVAELTQQSSLATIALTLTTASAGEPAGGEEDDGWGLGDAADDAGRALDVIGGALLLIGAVTLPFAALGVTGWVITRRRRRRLRDAALDG